MAVADSNIMGKNRMNRISRKISLALLAAIPGPAILWMLFVKQFVGLSSSDAMDLAQIGRHLVEGQGFATSYIRPFALLWTNTVGVQPDLVHAPLQSLVMALLFGVFGAQDTTAAVSSAIFFLATIPILYVLANRMFTKPVAILSVILYVINESLLGYALTGLPAMLSAFLLTLIFLKLYGKRNLEDESIQIAGRWDPFWIGALVAFSYLTDYSAVALIIPLGVFLYLESPEKRFYRVLLFLTAFFIISGPWMIRNYLLTGHPVFGLSQYETAMQTSLNPGFSMYRTLPLKDPAGLGFYFLHPFQGVRKLIGISLILYRQIPILAGIILTPFFLVSIFYTFKKSITPIRRTLYGMIFISIFICCMTRGDASIFISYIPIIILLAAVFIWHLFERIPVHPFYQKALIGLLIFVIAYPILMTLALGKAPARSTLPDTMIELQKAVPTNDPIVSDVPWAIAWYANRTAVWIPQTETDYQRIEDKKAKLNVICLTQSLGNYPVDEGVENWKQVYYSGSLPRGFQLVRVFEDRTVLIARGVKESKEARKTDTNQVAKKSESQ